MNYWKKESSRSFIEMTCLGGHSIYIVTSSGCTGFGIACP